VCKADSIARHRANKVAAFDDLKESVFFTDNEEIIRDIANNFEDNCIG